MKKTLLAVALSFTGVAVAQSPGGGGISTKEVMPELRTRLITINPTANRIVDEDDVEWGTFTVGQNGVLANIGYGTAIDQTSSFAVPLQPSKLIVGVRDASSNSSITCSAFTLYGIDQFGNSVSETLTMSTNSTIEFSATEREKGVLTAKVYEKIIRVKATCAASGTTTGDTIVILATRYVGLGMKISGSEAVKTVCYNRQNNTAGGTVGSTMCLLPGAADSSTAFDNAGTSTRIDVANSAIDLRTTHTLTGTVGGSKLATILVRAPNGSK